MAMYPNAPSETQLRDYMRAQAPMDSPHSSFRRYVEAGVYPMDWGHGEMSFDGVGRE